MGYKLKTVPMEIVGLGQVVGGMDLNRELAAFREHPLLHCARAAFVCCYYKVTKFIETYF